MGNETVSKSILGTEKNHDSHRRDRILHLFSPPEIERTLSAIGPYELRGKFIWTNHWSIPFLGEIRMDQWS